MANSSNEKINTFRDVLLTIVWKNEQNFMKKYCLTKISTSGHLTAISAIFTPCFQKDNQ